MEKQRDMKKHVTIVGVLHIVFGGMKLIGAVSLFFLFNYAQSFVPDVREAIMALTIIKTLIPILVGLGGILGVIGGIGLFSYKQWARILTIVVSALNCLSVPIGTAKGVYSIWALLQDETIKLFNEKAGVTPIN